MHHAPAKIPEEAVAALAELSCTEDSRAKVEQLETAMLGLPQVDCPIRHIFSDGLYAREMTVPANTVLTGAVHKVENIAVLSKGALVIATPNGPQLIRAPYTVVCRPGVKNAAVALEDSVWTNFFPTTETDPDKLVALLTESTADELAGGKDNPQLEANGGKRITYIKE